MDILSDTTTWIFGIGCIFSGGGLVYVITDTKKSVEDLMKNKVDKEVCNRQCNLLDVMSTDIKKLLEEVGEIKGELKHKDE